MSAQVSVDSSEGVLVPLNPSAADMSAVPAVVVPLFFRARSDHRVDDLRP
jgi:hypothetical protein